MNDYQNLLATLSLAMGTAWASGINLYAAVLVLGILGSSGSMTLPTELSVLQHPAVLSAAAVMFFIEFFVDKVPGLDSSWDAIHTFIRIPAGAVLAASAVGPVDPALMTAAGLVGGTLTATSHATKAGSRLLINTSPEPVTNIVASFTEDAIVIGGVVIAVYYPWLFLALLLLFLAIALWILPKIWRAAKHIGRTLRSFVQGLLKSAQPNSSARTENTPR